MKSTLKKREEQETLKPSLYSRGRPNLLKIGIRTYENRALDLSIPGSKWREGSNQLLLIIYYIYKNTVYFKGLDPSKYLCNTEFLKYCFKFQRSNMIDEVSLYTVRKYAILCLQILTQITELKLLTVEKKGIILIYSQFNSW